MIGLATHGLFHSTILVAQDVRKTYCNPINLDYGFCSIPDFSAQGKHRTTADPVIVPFKGRYFLFSTNQKGYWYSSDLLNWNFINRSFLQPRHKTWDDLCAPAAMAKGDTLLVIGSSYSNDFTLWMSTRPELGLWQVLIDSFPYPAWDPCWFTDDNGRIFLYHGSSNLYPLYGVELDKTSLLPKGKPLSLINLRDSIHGWERFGEYNDNTFLRPFIEGAWMTKYQDKYYLQYGAPGTEFSGYADGVYQSENPLGPFFYQKFNPFSYKPGGFTRGAGHGATFKDFNGQWWHVSTIALSVKNNFERRIGLWPAYFDADGILFTKTEYGDFPHYLDGSFTGWMLLNYNKPVMASTWLTAYPPNFAVDEDMKTYWSALTADTTEWFLSDLGVISEVRAIQVNFADQDADVMGKVDGLYHAYLIEGSLDGERWFILWDKRNNKSDVPHDYVELDVPIKARFVRIKNIHMPTGKFALSGLRVFGKADKPLPRAVQDVVVLRGKSEPRNAWIKWKSASDATGYILRFGVSPDKLYGSVMIWGKNEYWYSAMTADQDYYFSVSAFNEAGEGGSSEVIKAEAP
ncbi:MAG: family 43 glycosylhydrolase [Bacteroidales bacterium]